MCGLGEKMKNKPNEERISRKAAALQWTGNNTQAVMDRLAQHGMIGELFRDIYIQVYKDGSYNDTINIGDWLVEGEDGKLRLYTDETHALMYRPIGYGKPEAWLVPHYIDFDGASKVRFSRAPGCDKGDKELVDLLTGTVGWTAEIFHDDDSSVEDRYGVHHHPIPLYKRRDITDELERLRAFKQDALDMSDEDRLLLYGLAVQYGLIESAPE